MQQHTSLLAVFFLFLLGLGVSLFPGPLSSVGLITVRVSFFFFLLMSVLPSILVLYVKKSDIPDSLKHLSTSSFEFFTYAVAALFLSFILPLLFGATIDNLRSVQGDVLLVPMLAWVFSFFVRKIDSSSYVCEK